MKARSAFAHSKESASMSSTTFNSIARILVTDFHLDPARVRPETALAELGLDSLALMEFVFSVEDACQLRIPEELLDPREAGITLQRLCEVIDQMAGAPAATVPGHA
jgi:acyl carrier protein